MAVFGYMLPPDLSLQAFFALPYNASAGDAYVRFAAFDSVPDARSIRITALPYENGLVFVRLFDYLKRKKEYEKVKGREENNTP
ncbi:MAG: hypothetical protein IJD39_07580 [Clostridia bacterium]|nr:hypothetical protein [Clostridia bacterium]